MMLNLDSNGFLRTIVRFSLMFAFACSVFTMNAQFSFNYDGPDTLYVGASCTKALDWGHPQHPTAMATVGILTAFDIDSIGGGYSLNAQVPAGESVYVRYRAENTNGQIGFFSFTIAVADSTPPVFDILSIPPNITLDCGRPLPMFFPFVNDNCDPNGSNVTLTSGVILPTNICSADTTVLNQWIATDTYGNTSIHNQFITIRADTFAPLIQNVPNDTTFYCDNIDLTYTNWVNNFIPNVSINDTGCGQSMLQTIIPTANELNGCKDNFLYFIAVDSCGNSVADSTLVTIVDTLPAQFIQNPVDLVLDCSLASPVDTINHWIVNNGYGLAMDNCGAITWRVDTINSFMIDGCFGQGEFRFIVTDFCGNEDSSTASIIFGDGQGPTFDMTPVDFISSCQTQDVDFDSWIAFGGGAIVSDICSPTDSLILRYIVGNDTLSRIEVINLFSTFPNDCLDSLIIGGIPYYQINKSIDVSFLWTDLCGNSSSANAIFASLDLTPPFYNNNVGALSIECLTLNEVRDTFHSWIESVFNDGFSDACSDAIGESILDTSIILSQIITDLTSNCGATYSLPISFLGIDLCGNKSDTLILSFNYTDDGGLHVVQGAQNDSSYCSATPIDDIRDYIDTKGNAVVSDGCIGHGDWIYFTWDSVDVTKIGDFVSGPFPSPFISCNEPIMFDFFYADLCDTISTSGRFISIDTMPPFIINYMDTLYVACDSFHIPNVDVGDDCSMVSYSSSDSTIDVSNNPAFCTEHDLVVKRNYTLYDECANFRTYNQIVIALDEQGPTFDLPPDSIFDCSEKDTIYFGLPNNISDRCGDDIQITERDSVAFGNCSVRHMKIWSFTDVCGNTSVGIQTIIIADTTGPAWLVAPHDTIINCGSDYQEAMDVWREGVTAVDNCSATNIYSAIHGTYDLDIPSTYQSSPINIPNDLSCDSQLLLQIHVDFIAVDSCGNTNVFDVYFKITDNEAPVVSQHNIADLVTANPDSCGADVSIEHPWLYDDCMHGPTEPMSLRDTFNLSSISPGNQSILVSPIFLRRYFDENSIGISDISMRLKLLNADGEDEYERLIVIADNEIIGRTALTNNQCGDSDTTFIVPNIEFTHLLRNDTFAYNIFPIANPINPGAGSMNDICGGSMLIIELDFDVISVDSALEYFYVFEENDTIFSDDIPQNIFLQAGVHNWTFYSSDCAGNVLIDSGFVFVNDTLLPMITCPNDIDTILEVGACSIDIELPIPLYTDNCADTLSYQIFISGATTIGPNAWSPFSGQTFELNSGINRVIVTAKDESDNRDTCDYFINIIDQENPEIICQLDTILLPYDTVQIFQIDIANLDVSINDNCGIARSWTVPESVDCSDIGETIQIVYFVEDFAGNTDTCMSELVILNDETIPTFIVDICEPDTLLLFSNPPNSNNYTYQWQGPNSFTSSLENPIIINPTDLNKGMYQVTITNEIGCFGIGGVHVDFELQFEPLLSVLSDTICVGDSLILTSTFQNSSLDFDWYEGISPNGVLIGNTDDPSLTILPNIGSHNYYVIVNTLSCSSKPSNIVDVSVRSLPIAIVSPKSISICLGEAIDFESTSLGTGLVYSWTGPNNYTNNNQNPDPILSAQLFESGTYYLQVNDGYCLSTLDSVVVEVKEIPARPIISGTRVACENTIAILEVNNLSNIDSFIWTNNTTGATITTQLNQLSFDPFSMSDVGSWQVIVMRNGCPSLPSEMHLLSIEMPENIQISLLGDVACEGQDMQFLVDTFELADYNWRGDNFASDVQSPILPAVNGIFYLTVSTQAGCVMYDSLEVSTTPTPEIVSIRNNGIICIDGEAEVCFDVEIAAQPGHVNYIWTGPNNFTSSDSALCLTNATVDDNGIYTLVIEQNGCFSQSVVTLVQLTDISVKPIINGPDFLCEGSELLLTTDEFIGIGSVYNWITPNGEIVTSDSFLLIQNVSQTDEGFYAVYLKSNNCRTETSDSIFFDVVDPPNVQGIFGDLHYCEGSELKLSVNFEPGIEYLWLGPNGESSNDTVLVINQVFKDVHEGVYVLQARRPPCDYYNYFVDVEVTKLPLQPSFNLSTNDVCLDRNSIISVCADDLIQNEGAFYTISINGNQIGDSTMMLCQNINLLDNNLTEGVYPVQLELFINGCSSGLTNMEELNITEIPENINAFAGDDFVVCNELIDMLDAELPTNHLGHWVFGNDISIDDPSHPQSTFELEIYNEPTSLIWQLDYGACSAYTEDTVVVEAVTAVEANDDFMTAEIAQTINIPILSNDDLGQNSVTVEVISIPEIGEIEITPLQTIIYSPESYETGKRTIIYKICLEACPDLCDSATVQIIIGDPTDCEVPNIITPNNDQYNDYFVVQCFGDEENYENNELRVFNEWGSEVFFAAPYKNDWQGTYNGDPLPDGTYYYVLKYGNMLSPKAGFLVIQR